MVNVSVLHTFYLFFPIISQNCCIIIFSNEFISAPTGPPSDVLCTNRSSHSLTFTWQTPKCGNRNGPITNYSYTLLGPINQRTRNGSIPASENYTEVILDNLIPSSTYVFSVKAMNYDMSGEFGKIEASTTRAG